MFTWSRWENLTCLPSANFRFFLCSYLDHVIKVGILFQWNTVLFTIYRHYRNIVELFSSKLWIPNFNGSRTFLCIESRISATMLMRSQIENFELENPYQKLKMLDTSFWFFLIYRIPLNTHRRQFDWNRFFFYLNDVDTYETNFT